MRIYVLTPCYAPYLGGQEIYIKELSEGLAAVGLDVQVVTAVEVFPAGYVDKIPVRRLATYGATQGAGWRSIPWVILLLTRLVWRLICDARRYDAVLVSGFNVLPLAAVLAGLLTGKPVVVRPETPREVQEAVGEASRSKLDGDGSLVLRLVCWLRHRAAVRVQRYIAISTEIREKLVGQGIDPAKIVEISNGIDTGRFMPVSAERRTELRAALGLPADALLVIYSGRIALSKGIMRLLAVWRELAPQYPAAHLILVGEGCGSLDNCETQAREFVATQGLSARVSFAGGVLNVEEYLQASDVFAFPSDFEGFGLSVVEAMAVGLPMVCTRVGVAADLEREIGIQMIVPPMQEAPFRDALRRLLEDEPLRAGISRTARQTVQGRYSMTRVAEQHAALFSSLIESRTARAHSALSTRSKQLIPQPTPSAPPATPLT